MKYLSTIFFFGLMSIVSVEAQQNQEWNLNGSNNVISTIQSNSQNSNSEFPLLNLNWNYPSSQAESSYTIERNYQFRNEGALYLRYATENSGFTNQLKLGGGSFETYVPFTANQPSSFNENAKFYDKVLIENSTFSIGTSINDLYIPNGYKMQVKGNANFVNRIDLHSDLRLEGTNEIEFGWGVSKYSKAGKIIYEGADGKNLDIYGAGTQNDKLKIRLYDQVLINANDITGTHSDYKLGVKGKIVCTSLVCKTGSSSIWADYVFQDEYELMEYDDLRNFIKSNKHLPNIPKEEEVIEDGIDVGVMNAKLLQKIEELTLYVLDLENRIKQLEK